MCIQNCNSVQRLLVKPCFYCNYLICSALIVFTFEGQLSCSDMVSWSREKYVTPTGRKPKKEKKKERAQFSNLDIKPSKNVTYKLSQTNRYYFLLLYYISYSLLPFDTCNYRGRRLIALLWRFNYLYSC